MSILKKNVPVIFFDTAEKWRAWLLKNHLSSQGVRVRMFKKSSGKKSISYNEALDEALCFGWIDSQKQSYDQESWTQKFTPRRSKSAWSKHNTEHVNRLRREGRMTSAGLREVSAAKEDGRWEQAYDSPKNMKVPQDFLASLKKNKRAFAFFKTLNKSNTYAIALRLQTAKKPETRARRMKILLEMMAKEEKLH